MDEKAENKPKRLWFEPREGEVVGGGYFVLRRHRVGRVRAVGLPFEHGSLESALSEAGRLADKYPARELEVFRSVCRVRVATEDGENLTRIITPTEPTA